MNDPIQHEFDSDSAQNDVQAQDYPQAANPSDALESDELINSEDGLFPIRAVAQLTGINPITLRAWERRYKLICPTRTPTGHRLYSTTDIQQIQRVKSLSAQGVGFPQIAALLGRESRNTQTKPRFAAQPSPFNPEIGDQSGQNGSFEKNQEADFQAKSLIERLKQAVMHLDPIALRAVEQQALLWLPPEFVMRAILIEGLNQLEQREAWPDRDLSLHWLGHHLRQRLEWWLFQQARKPEPDRPLILIDTREADRPLRAQELLLIMSLAPNFTVKLLPPTLSEAQRARLINRWQARHWIRLLQPTDEPAPGSGTFLSGTTRLHWCQLLPGEPPLTITAAGVCQGGVIRCQQYLLKQLA
ncbi:MAG: MerR family transcriptional regulator [Halothiobacillus sp.]